MTRTDPNAPEDRHRMPRWVKAFMAVAVVAAAVVAASLLTGGGGHGPGRHLPGGGRHLAPAAG